ncbi:HAD family hydrolase [Marinobacter caseinilyticus]|uniref:HAD family hydrolase n=1 Tax=Marinobacter caseinilyticus TaxID=2692195 RepID=UPI00140A7210|nr:HAD family hydrolase [Marinobacter caseinilyticus]
MQKLTVSHARNFRGVAFDLDGTLVNSALDFRAIRRELAFPDGVGLLEHIATLSDPGLVEQAHGVIHRHEMAGAERATWMPGAESLLGALNEAGVPVAILTRNSRAAVRATCAVLEIPVGRILTREDCAPKPSPEGLINIAKHFGLRPAQMIYVGDFIDDLTSARRAGMAACLYRNGKNRSFASEARFVIDHFKELRVLLQSDG